ncbi:hypothetical protein CHRYSEOSP005_15150 [Chryseobacterium sp. Alg-005]|uniref:hypothetical protein n=1 Tax=Chryseobacterium sp. Alg-005 TaxID=3159516 RepID=UPI0035558EDA
MMQRSEYVLSRNLDSPYGKNSVFFETFVVPPEDFDKIPETKETEGIKYTFILCESGVEVFDRYQKDEVNDKEFKVFYEEDAPEKSNFFGTACRVKMGKEAKDFFNRIYSIDQNINFRGLVYDYTVNGFDNLVKVLAKEKKINETLLKGAIYLEIAEQSKLNEVYKKVFSLNNQLADWMKGGIETIEKWKFTEENYDYIKYYVNPMYNTYQNKIGTGGFAKEEVKYKPIIPVPISAREYKAMQNASEIAAAGFSKFKEFANYFEEVSLAIVTTVVKATPNITDDIFFAVVFYLKNFIEDNIPESIKNVYNKLKTFFKKVLEVFSGVSAIIGEKINQEVAKINAFLCGLLNGLISLAQTVIMLLAMVTDNIPFLEMEKMSPLELAKHQEKLEFIEDFVDLFAKNSKEFLSGIKSLFSEGKIWKELSKVIDGLKKKFASIKDYNQYFWAYFIGAVAFELILDAIIAYFTGGSSLVADLSAKISRMAAKAEQLGAKGIQLSKNLGGKIANSAQDLYKWLEKEFLEMLEAIKSGKVAEWIRKKIDAIFGGGNQIYDETEELFRDIFKKLIVNSKGVLSKEEFLKIAQQIEKHFETKLHWIDRESEEFAELYKKWYDNPIFAVFHKSTFKNGRYEIVLEGPAIYFFRGANKLGIPVEVTAYTLQHELIHMKLWYKMVKKFPEMAELYKKIPRWLDEANVLGEILKQNAQKIGKWETADIMNDLNTLNDNFRDYPHWKESLQKVLGKDHLDLKDFENWNLDEILKKL